MYALRKTAAGWEPIPGVPWRAMSDDEFEAASASYDQQHPSQPRSLERWFEHVADKKEKPGKGAEE